MRASVRETMRPAASSEPASLSRRVLLSQWPMNSQPSFTHSSTMRGQASQISLLSAAVPLTPWRSIASIMRNTPTRLP